MLSLIIDRRSHANRDDIPSLYIFDDFSLNLSIYQHFKSTATTHWYLEVVFCISRTAVLKRRCTLIYKMRYNTNASKVHQFFIQSRVCAMPIPNPFVYNFIEYYRIWFVVSHTNTHIAEYYTEWTGICEYCMTLTITLLSSWALFHTRIPKDGSRSNATPNFNTADDKILHTFELG